MLRFLVKTAFGGQALIKVRHLSYFDLIVKWHGSYLRVGAYKKKYSKVEDAQYSSWKPKSVI